MPYYFRRFGNNSIELVREWFGRGTIFCPKISPTHKTKPSVYLLKYRSFLIRYIALFNEDVQFLF